MKTIDINKTIIDGYLRLLENLSPSNKLDLISKLTLSVKSDMDHRQVSFYKAFGAWDKKESSENLIEQVRKSRTNNRQIEGL